MKRKLDPYTMERCIQTLQKHRRYRLGIGGPLDYIRVQGIEDDISKLIQLLRKGGRK